MPLQKFVMENFFEIQTYGCQQTSVDTKTRMLSTDVTKLNNFQIIADLFQTSNIKIKNYNLIWLF